MKIAHLSELTGVSPRNIKRYIHERLLASPEGRTKAARYTEAHRRELIRIESLRAAGLTLDEIRRQCCPLRASNEEVSLVSEVERPLIEYRYEVAEGIFIVFASGANAQDPASQAMLAERCRSLLKL